MFSKVFISIATFSALLGVLAQTTTSSSSSSLPTSPSQLTPCIITCTTMGLQKSNCASITDFQCLCTSSDFQNATTQCLMSQCTPQDLQTAIALQKVECANITSSSTGSSSGNSTASGSSSSSSTPSSGPVAPGSGSSSSSPSSPSSPSPTTPASGSSGANTSSPANSSSAAGHAHQFAFSLSHVVGLASALAGVLAGVSILF